MDLVLHIEPHTSVETVELRLDIAKQICLPVGLLGVEAVGRRTDMATVIVRSHLTVVC